jgi:hypothetical protein
MNRHRVICTAVVLAISLVLATIAGAASPTNIDPSNNEQNGTSELKAVECPSTSQCTVIDQVDHEVTFNPSSPGSPSRATIDGTSSPPVSLACPSMSQCTAIDAAGNEVTFDPNSPGTPTVTPLGAGGVDSLACPAATQCTAVGGSERVTFNPTAPGSPTPTALSNFTYSTGVACPSPSQCTAIGGFNTSGNEQVGEVTFNPNSSSSPTPTVLVTGVGYALDAEACSSTSECTAVDNAGQEVTFNPTAPGTPTPTTIDAGTAMLAVACPSTSQCTAVDSGSHWVTFNPNAAGHPTATVIPNIFPTAVACPSTRQCTLVDEDGDEETFDPASSSATPTPVLGQSVAASLVSGQVLVERPGTTTFVPLTASTLVPVGSTVNATNGTVKLRAAGTVKHVTHAGEFSAGEFMLTQARSGLTDLTLVGGTVCAASAATTPGSPHHARKLWGTGHGSFETTGRYASATELGTRWLTQDTCTGTLISVTSGAVRVSDVVTHKSFVLRAPHKYVAHR